MPISTELAQKPAISALEAREWIIRELKHASNDVFYYFSHVKTHDPHSTRHGKIEPWPMDKTYVTKLIQECVDSPKIAVYKSRQMLVSWTIVGYCLWRLLFTPGSYIGFISKKEEDAGKLIGRARVIYQNLPDAWKIGLPEVDFYHGKKAIPVKMVATFPEGQTESIIQAFPEGGDQVRMETFSLVYWDEVGFCRNEEAYATYAAVYPTVSEGTAQFIMTSTPPRDPDHFWQRFVEGRLFMEVA